jgi:NhaA family Na+:H+ antiporter
MKGINFNKTFADRWFVDPINSFINNSKLSGILLFVSASLALIIANSPWVDAYHHLWEIEISVGIASNTISKSLHHWINDGLMAIFFFVVGLELKREVLVGGLREPKNAIIPIVAAIAGMFFPALIYALFNSGETINGWGIPMATDIAFALGVLYLMGDRVPTSLKIFLTAIAIVDDLGAVLVVAFFYTSEIDFNSLITGFVFLMVLIVANRIGVRSTLFFGIVGIGGVWLAFLMSGVHATIAAVLAAFAIPASSAINDDLTDRNLGLLLKKYKDADPNDNDFVTKDQQHVLEKIRFVATNAIPPLQRLEHSLHPLVAFVIMPIFAFSNAGVTLGSSLVTDAMSNVAISVSLGLIIGKVIGITGGTWFCLKFNIGKLADDINMKMVFGISFLGAVGFTMSLFIAGLAFNTDAVSLQQAKLGIIMASILASLTGYYILNKNIKT